jgi:hypothetical protein
MAVVATGMARVLMALPVVEEALAGIFSTDNRGVINVDDVDDDAADVVAVVGADNLLLLLLLLKSCC